MARRRYRRYYSRFRGYISNFRRKGARIMRGSFINKRIVKFLPIKWWHIMAAFALLGILFYVKMKKAGASTEEIIKSVKPVKKGA